MHTTAAPTILVVEDSQNFQQMLKAHLELEGYTTILCDNGVQALLWLEEHGNQVDLALVDVVMPEMDGLTLTRTIRRSEQLKDLPVLLLTGLSEPREIEEGLSTGANDYMTKPFHPIELKARVNNLLRVQRIRRQLLLQYQVMQHDLEIARDLQLSLIPVSPLHSPNIRVAWAYHPSSYVGGDMVNVFAISEEHYGLYVADVSGHGVASAMLSTWLHHTLKPTFEQISPLTPTTTQFTGLPLASPRSVAVLLDQMLAAKSSEHYLTLCYGVYHAPSQRITYVRCGHPYPILVTQEGRCEVLKEADGPAIGMSLGLRFTTHTRKLASGDRLFLYSDAILEAPSSTGEQFGLEQLCVELIASTHYRLEDQVAYILSAVQEHQQDDDFNDDVTFLAMEVP